MPADVMPGLEALDAQLSLGFKSDVQTAEEGK